MTEMELIESLRRGDAAGMRELRRAHRRRLHRKACCLFGDLDPEASEVVEETLRQAFENIGAFEGGTSLAGWLNHLCANACFASLRRRLRQAEASQAAMHRAMAPWGEVFDRGRRDEALRSQRLGRLQFWSHDLDPQARHLLRLRHMEGFSITEIRQRLGLPLGIVASRLARCHQEVRSRISERAWHV